METYWVYIDKTIIEEIKADRYEILEDCIIFYIKDTINALFFKDKIIGFIKESD